MPCFQINYNEFGEKGRLMDAKDVVVKKLNGRDESTQGAEEYVTRILFVYLDVAGKGTNAWWFTNLCQITVFKSICFVCIEEFLG